MYRIWRDSGIVRELLFPVLFLVVFAAAAIAEQQVLSRSADVLSAAICLSVSFLCFQHSGFGAGRCGNTDMAASIGIGYFIASLIFFSRIVIPNLSLPFSFGSSENYLRVYARSFEALSLLLFIAFRRHRFGKRISLSVMLLWAAALPLLLFVINGPAGESGDFGHPEFLAGASVAVSAVYLLSTAVLSRQGRSISKRAASRAFLAIVFGVSAQAAAVFETLLGLSFYDASAVLGCLSSSGVLSMAFVLTDRRADIIHFSRLGRSRKRLRASETRMRQTLAMARLGSWEVDPESEEGGWSAGMLELFGESAAGPIPGEDMVMRGVDEKDRAALVAFLQRTRLEGGEHSGDFRFSRQDGEVWHGRIVCSSGPDTGRGRRMLYTVQDVTHEKRAEELRDDVERITHHDLRTPINAVIFTTYLLEKTSLDGGQSEFVENIRTTCTLMHDQINRSLNLYRIERGTYRLEPERLELLSVIDRAMKHLDPLRDGRNLTISPLLNGERPGNGSSCYISGEESLLYTLIVNLLKNAMEASPYGESIQVDMYRNDHMVIAIKNCGAVPEEMRTCFFEKYASAGKPGGTGLGTYSARLIAEVHGGSIELTSANEQETEVTVSLPLESPGDGKE